MSKGYLIPTDKYQHHPHFNVIPAEAGIQSTHLSYRDLIAVSKLFIKLDPVVKPRYDAEYKESIYP